MPGMTCNIDRRGRWARGISGALCAAFGLVLLIGLVDVAPWVRWLGGVFLLLAGLFQFVEAAIGWCVVRAMGFRTPM